MADVSGNHLSSSVLTIIKPSATVSSYRARGLTPMRTLFTFVVLAAGGAGVAMLDRTPTAWSSFTNQSVVEAPAIAQTETPITGNVIKTVATSSGAQPLSVAPDAPRAQPIDPIVTPLVKPTPSKPASKLASAPPTTKKKSRPKPTCTKSQKLDSSKQRCISKTRAR